MKALTLILSLILSIAILRTVIRAQSDRPPQETLQEAVRRVNGPVGRHQPAPLGLKTSFDALVKQADVIVQGVLGEPRSYLAEDSTTIYTDYVVQNGQFLYSSVTQNTTMPAASREVTLTQLGGELILDGHRVVVSHSALQPLKANTEGIFLLTSRGGKYFLVRDYLGAYEIRNGLIMPLTEEGGLGSQIRGKSVGEFRDEMASILRQIGR